jgi:hypothetical protein
MRRAIRSFASAVSLALLTPGVVAAQFVTIRGTVRDTAGVVIPQAEVWLIGKDHKALSAENGSFTLKDVRAGKYWLGVRRLGYEPIALSLTINGDRTQDVEMWPLAQRLSAVEVREQSGLTSAPFSAFEMRRWTQWGWFLTRDDLERLRPVRLGYAIQPYMPWLLPEAFDHAPVERGAFATRATGRNIGRGACAPAVSLNGTPAVAGWAVNDFFPDEVEAVEIYRNRDSRIPYEFWSMPGARTCGLVVVWTKA